MMEWISGLTGLEQIFFACAAFGGSLLVIRVILQITGVFDIDHDIDVGGDVDLDAGTDVDAPGHGSDVSFKFISLHGLLAFFMMFGLTGLTMTREFEAGPPAAIGVALLGGMVSMVVIQLLFAGMLKLQHSGTLDHGNAVGEEGSVYLTIPAGGRGKVQVAVQGRLKVFDAVAEQPGELKTGAHIRVVRVIEASVLVVEKAG